MIIQTNNVKHLYLHRLLSLKNKLSNNYHQCPYKKCHIPGHVNIFLNVDLVICVKECSRFYVLSALIIAWIFKYFPRSPLI